MTNPIIDKLIAMREHDDALNPSDVTGVIAAIGVAKYPETIQRLAVHGMALAERENTDFGEFNDTLDKIQRAAQTRLGEMANTAT